MKRKNVTDPVLGVNEFSGDDACDEIRRGDARSRSTTDPANKTMAIYGRERPTRAMPCESAAGQSNVTRSTALSAVRPIPRRGLSRDEAAMYIGISASKFDELVRDGRMPGPKRIDGRKLWDVHALDLAFVSLPDDNDQGVKNSFDDAWVGEHR